MNFIKIINCSKKYKDNVVLNDINYTFEKGKFYAIMSKSGTGKTTLINILAGLIKNDNGFIKYDVLYDDIYKVRNKNLGLVYQNYLLNENMTVYENIELPLFLNDDYNKIVTKKNIYNLLKDLRIDKLVDNFPNSISGGEQQRVAIARALINNPDFVIADEPTGNLDEENEKIIFDYFKRIKERGKGIIVATHSKNIRNYCDILLTIKGGKLIEDKKFYKNIKK